MKASSEQPDNALRPYLTPLGAWALALGTAIGWGSLVVTSNTYLLQAGPWGSVLGLVVGAVIMTVVARNYHYMMNCFPDAGGSYTYAKEVFGHDYGFLTAWFLALTYLAVLLANLTSLPLFSRYFLRGIFQFGFHYSVLGYEVYLGEVLLCIAAIALTIALCMFARKAAVRLVVGLCVLLTLAILASFAASALGFTAQAGSIEPGFIPDKNALSQIVLIACISPWAFIGFENISHSVEEFTFPRNRTFRIMIGAIAAATLLYLCVLLLSTMAYPPQYASWLEYLSDLPNLEGVEALPPFYVAYHYLGDPGIYLLMTALLGLVVTSLIGNTIALSRLFYALGKDNYIPPSFAKVNAHGTPGKAFTIIAAAAVIMPFFGRVAIGWIVDVTTIGATIVYAFVSASTLKIAHARGDTTEYVCGALGVVCMIGIGMFLLLPLLFRSQTLATESYFLFAAWGIVGFIAFRRLMSHDKQRRFGRSVVVWVGLLALVMFVSFVWTDQALMEVETATSDQIAERYDGDTVNPAPNISDDVDFIEDEFAGMRDSSTQIMLVEAILLALASILMLANFSYMSRWAQRSEEELDQTRNIIYTDPLTGLPSFARFQELARVGADAILRDGDRPVAIALDLVGMSDFRTMNGHEESNRLLCTFADVLRARFGENACSRSTEDHFYAYASLSDAADKIETVFSDFESHDGSGHLPIRVGAYTCNPGDDITSTGLHRARSACDVDRTSWQSHVSWFSDDMSDEANLRLHILEELDRAIKEGWVRPYYQAIVWPETQSRCSEEALARWIDPQYGPLSPNLFIPILEEAGLLYKLDLRIVECVLEDFKTKREAGIPVVPVSVNISLRDLEQLDMTYEIEKRVEAAGISRNLLRIEFTESAASENPAAFKMAIQTLHDAGFEVWMDDFGSGYSSLNALKSFDFDLVKLDMEFLRGGTDDQRTWDVIAGIAQIARKLGMKMLAEGVETSTQVKRLERVGCDMLQGYYYAKPQPLDEIIASYNA